MRKTTIDEAIARVDDWKGKEISYKPVSGGITNPNFKVDGRESISSSRYREPARIT